MMRAELDEQGVHRARETERRFAGEFASAVVGRGRCVSAGASL